MDDTYRERSDLAKIAENYFKEMDSWARCDAARMGGHTCKDPLPSYNHYTDEDLIRRYLQEQRDREFWANDRR
jgi:hypothetical protein